MDNKKRQKIYRTIMLIVVVAIVTFVVTSIINYDGSRKYLVSSQEDAEIATQIENAIASITEIIEEKYIGEVDKENLVDGAIKGMVESIGDVYTTYYTEEELDDFTATTLGNFVGIGVYMQADYENNTITVISTVANSPAEKAGIQKGDLILKADDVEYEAKEIEELSAYIRGEEGTQVKLTILRNDETMDITVTRGSVHINYVSSELLENNIGYIYIETFDEGCKDDFVEAYNKLAEQGAKGLIIDLRYNGGGLVDEALDIADLFCDRDDTLLITVDKEGNQEITKSETDPTITMPVTVITNGASASAAEILAAVLRDNGKAEIVGETTYGKGVIQELIYLSNGGAIKVTSQEYYTPNGEKINEVGISPDYTVTGIDEQLEKAQEILNEKIK